MKPLLSRIFISASFIMIALSSPSWGMEEDENQDFPSVPLLPFCSEDLEQSAENALQGRIRIKVVMEELESNVFPNFKDFFLKITTKVNANPTKCVEFPFGARGLTLSLGASGVNETQINGVRALEVYLFTDEKPFDYGININDPSYLHTRVGFEYKHTGTNGKWEPVKCGKKLRKDSLSIVTPIDGERMVLVSALISFYKTGNVTAQGKWAITY